MRLDRALAELKGEVCTLFMRNCSDDLRIDHGPTGTTVVIRRRLAEQARR